MNQNVIRAAASRHAEVDPSVVVICLGAASPQWDQAADLLAEFALGIEADADFALC
jgi:hypothetical protein